MRIHLRSLKPVTVLKKVTTDYDVNGNKGTTYRLALELGDDIEKVKCVNKEVWESIPVGQPIDIVMVVNASGGSCNEPKVCDYKLADGKPAK